jgi:hypothetical protein
MYAITGSDTTGKLSDGEPKILHATSFGMKMMKFWMLGEQDFDVEEVLK